MPTTPILNCQAESSIQIHTSPAPLHPHQSPSFTIPPTLLSHLDIAASHLRSSQTVAFPTETVYGLGANSLDSNAVRKIYSIKNRPADNPLIMHVSSLDMLSRLLPPDYQPSRLYLALLDTFWPGPLTLLFPSTSPPPPPAPQTNAIRMPSHPLALALIHHTGLPLSAPSANSSGRPSPTKAQHVYNDLNGAEGLALILDGGDCGVGVESTVVNGLGWKEGGGGTVDILRPGGLGVEEIERVVRMVDGDSTGTEILLHGKPWPWRRTTATASSRIFDTKHKDTTQKVDLPPSTPGMKYRHYSPRIPVYLLFPSTIFPRPPSLPSSFDSSPASIMRQIKSLCSPNGKRPTLGLLHFDKSPLSSSLLHTEHQADIVPISLGLDSSSAAQRLFSGMLALEGSTSDVMSNESVGDFVPITGGADAILIEGCLDGGLGLAVMERVGKAVGGGGMSGELGKGEEVGAGQGRFWVQV